VPEFQILKLFLFFLHFSNITKDNQPTSLYH
jgi:hypothetical protein